MTLATREDYQRAFDAERAQSYPEIDAYEQSVGYPINRDWMEAMARVLACPVKKNPPNWQHGRVLYATLRQYLAARESSAAINVLDIGTAKGFSAVVMLKAADDAQRPVHITSVDVIDPQGRVTRNTVAEVDGLKTLAETLLCCPGADRIDFLKSTGLDYLQRDDLRIHFAFIDGKHTGDVVRREGVLLAKRQQTGDMVVFDDVHIPDVSVAVNSLNDRYRLRYLRALESRQYAVGVRR